MLCAFSKHQPSAPPVLSGKFDFNSSRSSTDRLWSVSNSDATRPNRRCRIFHLRAAMWTSMSLSLGSSMCCSPCSGDPGTAQSMAALTHSTYIKRVIHDVVYVVCYDIIISHEHVKLKSGAAYLWSYEISEQKRQSEKQYPDSVACHVLACMLVNVHVNEMCCIRWSDFDHGWGGVQWTQSISEACPNAPHPRIRNQRPVWTTIKCRSTQDLHVGVKARRNDILSIHSNEKLVKFLPGDDSRQVQVLCLEKCVGWTQFVLEFLLLGFDLAYCSGVE